MPHTEMYLARHQERDDEKRRAQIRRRRDWVRSPEYAAKLAQERAARERAARSAEIAAAARLVEELDFATNTTTLSRAIDKIDVMIEDAKDDFPGVSDCDIAHDMIMAYVHQLKPTRRNLGLTAAILRCELSWTAAEVAERFLVSA